MNIYQNLQEKANNHLKMQNKNNMKTKFLYTFLAAFLMVGLGVSNAQIDRTKQPAAGPAPTINLGTPQTFELKNGLKVMVVENHKLPRVNVTLAIENGPIYEGDKAGVQALTGSVLGSGTTNMSKDDFNKRVDFLGANIGFTSQSANLNTLSKYFEETLGLMADGAINPVFTQEEFDKQQKQLIEGIKSNENSVDAISGIVEDALMYGKNHSKGEFTSAGSAEGVTLEDVKKFYNTYYKPDNAYLIVIGDVKFSKAKKIIKNAFGDWAPGSIPNYENPEVSNVSVTEVNIVNMPNAVQSSIAISNTVALKKADVDYYSVLLANYILGGGGTARLYNNLREEHGYTYGAYSSVGNDHIDVSRFTAQASVRNEVTDSAVVEFLNEIKRIRTDLVTADELKTAKAAYTGSFVRALEQPSTAAQYALNIETEGLPKDYYETYLKKLNAVTIEDINRVAKKYFLIDNFRIMIVGKGADIIPGLESLGFPINYFDKEANPTEKPEINIPIPDGVTVKTVLEGYINAIGGADKIAAVESVITNYEGTMPMGTIAVVETRVSDKYAQSTLVNGNAMMGVVATQEEMFMKQGGQKIPLPPTFLEDTKATMGTFYELALLKSDSAALVGIEKVNGSNAYVIEWKGNSMSNKVFYDTSSGLKVKEVSVIDMGGQQQTSESKYADYKEVDGILFANKRSSTFGPQTVEMSLKEALINSGVSDEDFQ